MGTKLEKALLLGMLGNLVHDLVSVSKTSKALIAYLDCLPPGAGEMERKGVSLAHSTKQRTAGTRGASWGRLRASCQLI